MKKQAMEKSKWAKPMSKSSLSKQVEERNVIYD